MVKFDENKYNMTKEFHVELDKINSRTHYEEWKKFYQDEKERLKNLWETDFPGIPMGSIMLENGKNYNGDADGDFEIKTIDGELWFIPGGCCNFGEKF